jgi:hypothetical protein
MKYAELLLGAEDIEKTIDSLRLSLISNYSSRQQPDFTQISFIPMVDHDSHMVPKTPNRHKLRKKDKSDVI